MWRCDSVERPEYLDTKEGKKNHPYSSLWLGWSMVGLIGGVLNSFVLFIFWKERQSLNSSVNTMIWYSMINALTSAGELITFLLKFFSINTLFRVFYTVAIGWRTYLMFCGPEGGWGCVSVISREMVTLLSWKKINLFFKDCNLMTMFVILNAVSSLIFGVLTSAIRFGCTHGVITASLISST